MASSDDTSQQTETSFARRLRLVFWHEHQPWVAVVLALGLFWMITYFSIQSWQNQGLIDIDEARQRDYRYLVDLNTAGPAELVVLPGIGTSLAEAIVAYRQQNGLFKSIDAIENVPGIGNGKRQQLTPYLLPITADRHRSKTQSDKNLSEHFSQTR